MANGLTTTHTAKCAFCEGELRGGERQQNNGERSAWVHATPGGERVGGLHTAYPVPMTAREV